MTAQRTPGRRVGDDFDGRLRALEQFRAGLEVGEVALREMKIEAHNRLEARDKEIESESKDRDKDLADVLERIEDQIDAQGKRQAYFAGAVGVLVVILGLIGPVLTAAAKAALGIH